ncbi:MAG: response regulator [SAR324 cluster bacterium]|nr:response regulator [SAR324 cluster bacterium]
MARILVIDDDDNYRFYLKEALTKAGYEVVEAQDGKFGLRFYRKQKFDLVITDIFMPETEGMETILTLKKEFPDVKIIAVSGGGVGGDPDTVLVMAKQMGAEQTLSKPIRVALLLETVAKVLS